ncbi:MAG TPA: chromate efflux transporter [Gemmatimonadaceae bacterium]|nr:chromate efflux transporter [Gemmatimonadaceae bacterium]
MAEIAEPTPRASLGEIARLFLRLGAVSFGGPAAHIALMEEEIVRRRRWLTHDEFLDLLGAVNVMPGPNSTELAIHIGLVRGGWAGLLVAGACFIVPAAVMVAALAWAYVRFGALPAVAGILAGVTPVVIAIVLQAIWNLGRSALRTRALWVIGVASVAAAAWGVHELAVLLAAGTATWIASATRRPASEARSLIVTLAVPAAGAGAVAVPFALTSLFLVFLKIGAVLFGSGYVLLAFLRADLVVRLGWLTERQLLDAVAVGQVTPGPVFTTATFIGYLLGGPGGAVIATIGIFLPAFVFVAASGVLLPRLRTSPGARAALDGVNVASLALMVVVTAQLARTALADAFGILIAAASAVALIRFRVGAAWLVLIGALLGALLGAVLR